MEAQASFTAIAAAGMRAAHLLLDGEPKVFRDDLALRFSGADSEASLREDMNAMLAEVASKVGPDVALKVLQGGRSTVIMRSRYTEDELNLAIKRGAAVPVVRILGDVLNKMREGMGILATPESPIFQAGNGQPLNLDNLARRVIVPALQGTGVKWHGWHSWRRGLATTLHQLGVEDKTIQAILRHSNISVTMNVYVKSVAESQVSAMDALSARIESEETCNDLATKPSALIN